MKISKTKIKFTDIAGMLDRDQMREITGGCGVSTGSAMTIQSGGLGCSASWSNTSSCWSSIMGMGFGGALSYGGVSANSSGVSSAGTANGYTTNNPTEISALYGMLTTGKAATDCVFQSMAYLASLYGDTSVV